MIEYYLQDKERIVNCSNVWEANGEDQNVHGSGDVGLVFFSSMVFVCFQQVRHPFQN